MVSSYRVVRRSRNRNAFPELNGVPTDETLLPFSPEFPKDFLHVSVGVTPVEDAPPLNESFSAGEFSKPRIKEGIVVQYKKTIKVFGKSIRIPRWQDMPLPEVAVLMLLDEPEF
jgi:hypothetical protein